MHELYALTSCHDQESATGYTSLIRATHSLEDWLRTGLHSRAATWLWAGLQLQMQGAKRQGNVRTCSERKVFEPLCRRATWPLARTSCSPALDITSWMRSSAAVSPEASSCSCTDPSW